MKRIATLALVALALVAIGYRATHTPIYGNCHTTADGRVCTLLKWEVNK